MRKAVLTNPESYSSNNVSGRTPIIEYKGFKLKGSWELETAKWLDRNNIEWNRPSYFPWQDDTGKNRKYYPDFYLVKENKYVDIKNDFLIQQHKVKLDSVVKQNKINLEIVNRRKLNEILAGVVQQ